MLTWNQVYAPVLGSSGGVMGKMIGARSIVVAGAP